MKEKKIFFKKINISKIRSYPIYSLKISESVDKNTDIIPILESVYLIKLSLYLLEYCYYYRHHKAIIYCQ